MSKYNIYATREDWDKIYKAVEPFGEHVVKKFKKMSSMDTATSMYAVLTKDYKLVGLGYLQKSSDWCECDEKVRARGSEYSEDGYCECGVEKHHYHCLSCRKLTQIG